MDRMFMFVLYEWNNKEFLSKPIAKLNKNQLRKVTTSYLQEVGFGVGGLKKYGKGPAPSWWPSSALTWATFSGPYHTNNEDLRKIITALLQFYRIDPAKHIINYRSEEEEENANESI